jgi:hypothetical protein
LLLLLLLFAAAPPPPKRLELPNILLGVMGSMLIDVVFSKAGSRGI